MYSTGKQVRQNNVRVLSVLPSARSIPTISDFGNGFVHESTVLTLTLTTTDQGTTESRIPPKTPLLSATYSPHEPFSGGLDT